MSDELEATRRRQAEERAHALRGELDGLSRTPDRPAKDRRMVEIRAALGEPLETAEATQATSSDEPAEAAGEPADAADHTPRERAVPKKSR